MNVDLLLKVRAAILEEPKRIDMEAWSETKKNSCRELPKCGAVACISGWACVLDVRDKAKAQDNSRRQRQGGE